MFILNHSRVKNQNSRVDIPGWEPEIFIVLTVDMYMYTP